MESADNLVLILLGHPLCSKGCVILFFAGSMVGVMSQYFGEPIQCDFKVSLQLSKDCTYRDGK